MQKNGENQPLSSEIIADLEEKLMARGQNERGGKDNRRNICRNRDVYSNLLNHMDVYII